jgi:hypothetical protein
MGTVLLAAAACETPETPLPPPEAAAGNVTACRDIVRSAGLQAYSLARHRDDQRAVILLPAGKAAADYEAETKRLRDEGARLMAALGATWPVTGPTPAVPPGSVTEAQVAGRIAEADACLANAAG